jgi:hypothetical protein
MISSSSLVDSVNRNILRKEYVYPSRVWSYGFGDVDAAVVALAAAAAVAASVSVSVSFYSKLVYASFASLDHPES